MKILITLIGAQTGSVANYSLLFRAWAEEFPGDELYIFCNWEVAWYYKSRLRFLGLPNVHVIPWRAGLFKEPLRFWFHTYGLHKYIRQYSPDLIYSINIGPYFTTGIPQVIQVNNSFQVCDWSLVRYHPGNRFHVAVLRFFFRFSLKRCNAAVVQTEGMRKLLASIPYSPERLAVIPKSVETERGLFPHPLPERIRQQLATGPTQNVFTYLYVATDSRHKNHITLIRAMEYARAQNSPLRLVLTLTKKELERLAGREAKTARSLVESGHIMLLGWITKDILRGLYDACSGCVMPSLLESMSSSHLEAMRWNKPQISSDIPCFRELCGDASLYVPVEDPQAWFREMERLARDPALQADLVEKGAKRILDFPQTWHKVASKYRSLFEEVIAESHAKPKTQTPERRDEIVPQKSRRMKILYENFGGPSGALSGYVYFIRALALEYPEDEYVIHCMRGSGLDKLADLPNVQILYIKEFAGKEFMRFYNNQWNVKKIVRRYRPDLILSTNIGPYIRTGIPQVLHLMNAFQWCELPKTKYHPKSKLSILTLRYFFRRSLRKCDAAIVETPLVRDEVGRIPGAPGQIAVIPKTVENEYDLHPQPLPETISRFFNDKPGNEFFTFLYVATYSPHKNIKIWIPAMQILKDRGVKARLALSLTEEELTKYFGRQAADLIASGHILPLGWVNKEHLHSLYQACSACVMPSLLECLSGSYLEAMNWGKPQICSDLPFAHDTCGPASIYADPENPREWADKMQKLMEDQPLRETLVQEGYKRINLFSATWIEVAKKAHSLFESLTSH